jgi:hypothetical protein
MTQSIPVAIENRKTSLCKILIIITCALITLIGAIIYYLGWVFPATASMFTRFGIPVPPMTAGAIKVSDFVFDNIWWISGCILLPMICSGIWFITDASAFYRLQRTINEIPTRTIIFICIVMLITIIVGITLLAIVFSEVAFITPPTPGTGNIM